MPHASHCAIRLRVHDYPLEFRLVRISALKPHEYVLGTLVERLASSMLNENTLKDPVVADEDTGVVLDGMHRLQALKRLKAKTILVYSVDYADPEVKVGRWLRSFDAPPAELLEEIADKLGFSEVESVDRALALVDSKQKSLALVGLGGKPLVTRGSYRGSLHSFWLLWRLEKMLAEHALTARIITDRDLKRELESGRIVAYVAEPTKNDVLNSALRNKLYPPKSTRHILRVRPVNVRVPLNYLLGENEPCKISSQLKAMLLERAKKAKLLPEGSLYSGRIYEEKLIAFAPNNF